MNRRPTIAIRPPRSRGDLRHRWHGRSHRRDGLQRPAGRRCTHRHPHPAHRHDRRTCVRRRRHPVHRHDDRRRPGSRPTARRPGAGRCSARPGPDARTHRRPPAAHRRGRHGHGLHHRGPAHRSSSAHRRHRTAPLPGRDHRCAAHHCPDTPTVRRPRPTNRGHRSIRRHEVRGPELQPRPDGPEHRRHGPGTRTRPGRAIRRTAHPRVAPSHPPRDHGPRTRSHRDGGRHCQRLADDRPTPVRPRTRFAHPRHRCPTSRADRPNRSVRRCHDPRRPDAAHPPPAADVHRSTHGDWCCARSHGALGSGPPLRRHRSWRGRRCSSGSSPHRHTTLIVSSRHPPPRLAPPAGNSRQPWDSSRSRSGARRTRFETGGRRPARTAAVRQPPSESRS